MNIKLKYFRLVDHEY